MGLLERVASSNYDIPAQGQEGVYDPAAQGTWYAHYEEIWINNNTDTISVFQYHYLELGGGTGPNYPYYDAAAGGTFYGSAGVPSYLVVGDFSGSAGAYAGLTPPATLPSLDSVQGGTWYAGAAGYPRLVLGDLTGGNTGPTYPFYSADDGGTFYRSADNLTVYLVVGDVSGPAGANGVYDRMTVPSVLSFDYVNNGTWSQTELGLITFTPAIQQQTVGYKAELYSYNLDGYLVSVREASSGYDYLTGLITPPDLASAYTRSLTSYDAMGRVTSSVEYAPLGVTPNNAAQYERFGIVYDLRGQVIAERGRTLLAKQGGFDTLYTHTVNNYSATGLGPNSPPIVSAGQVGSSTGSLLYFSETKNWLNGPANPFYGATNNNGAGRPDFDYADAYTRYSYSFYEAEVQAQVKLINRDAPAGVDSNFTYDGLGRLSNVSVGGPRAHTLTYVNDINGQVLSRTLTRVASGIPGTSNPVQYYHYYNGIMLGANGNNGNDRPDMATALNERIAQGPTTPGVFRNGGTGPNPYADFDQAYDAVSPETFSQGPSAYTVRSGDTLESIAAQVWGDASLWYMLAEANPSASRGTLTAGTSLIIPNKVANFHNTSDTFRPYDAERAIGDTQPGTPKPPKAKGCGVVGQIILVAIAIAVAAISQQYQIFAFLGKVGALAAGAALGSVVSQGVGVATGIQDKFSWKQVGLAAVGSLAGSALKGLTIFKEVGKLAGAAQVANDVIRGALSNALTQGVGVATGLQDKFSWAGVAAAGVGAGVGGIVGRSFGIGGAGWEPDTVSDYGKILATGLASGIASAATRSVIEGTDFGDNLIASLPDVLGSTIGQIIGDAADGWGVDDRPERAAFQEAVRVAIEGAQTRDANGAVGPTRELKLDPKALGMTMEQFVNAMGGNHSGEIRTAVAQMFFNGKNLPRFLIGDLGATNAMFDPKDGEFGTITLNAKLLDASVYRDGFGSLAAWGFLEEIGHWADRQAHIQGGNPTGQTLGDEGGRFAAAALDSFIGNSDGMYTARTLGSVDGQSFSLRFDNAVLKGIRGVLTTNGYMDQEHKIGDVETYHPDGHYAATFLTAFATGSALGMGNEKNRSIAMELALGSQLPDMLAHFDAKSLAEIKAKDSFKEGLLLKKKGTYWTADEEAHLRSVYRGLHGLPETEAEATTEYLDTERKETSKLISEKIAARDFIAAGVAIHRLGDLYAHVRSDGRPYWGDFGHGTEELLSYLGDDQGRSPDFLFYKPNYDRFRGQYIPALSNAIAIGFKNGRLAQNNNSLAYAADVSGAFFDSVLKDSKVKVTSKYSVSSLTKRETNFFSYFRTTYGSDLLTHAQAGVGGGFAVSDQRRAKIKPVMNDLKD